MDFIQIAVCADDTHIYGFYELVARASVGLHRRSFLVDDVLPVAA